MEFATTFIVLACLFGFFMAFGIGANDVANAMGTSVGSRAITGKQAILIAIVFEFTGAMLAGAPVTETIRQGILDINHIPPDQANIVVYGMLASLLGAGTWLIVATSYGWPVSTTHSIIGAIVGFGVVAIGMDAVQWDKIGIIAISWVVSPLCGGVLAFVLFMSAQRLIFDTEDPFKNAKRYIPFYIFLTGFVISIVTTTKGLRHLGLDLTTTHSIVIAVAIGLAMTFIGHLALQRIKIEPSADKNFHFHNVERTFAILMIFAACATAFAHGSNDVANAIGPLATVFSIISTGGQLASKAEVPLWILFLGSIGIVIGLMTYGSRVMETIGTKITPLTPSRGFAATLGAATTVVLASGTGMPISTTHVLVGAVLGVGLARGIHALRMSVINKIFLSWLITLPVGAILSIIFFYIIKAIFGS